MIRIFSLFMLLLICFFQNLSGQPKIIDEVVAVVGDKKILYSDIEQTALQLIQQGDKVNEDTKCTILEDLLIQKLLLNQAEVDSIEITESEVDGELEARMQYFINAFGSETKLEDYFKKSTIEIKKDLREDISEMVLSRKMRRNITEGLSVTPSDVKSYYRNLPTDSLPYVNAEVEFNQILIYPKSTEQAITVVREKLLGIRERIINGESFATLAVVYSEDGSAVKGGDIGWSAKTDVDPEYAKAAFALKKGGISKIVESSFGFHLIQCLDKTEDRIHTRHIFIRPKVDMEEKNNAINRLDSIIRLVRLDSLKFDKAAMVYSQDKDTRVNGGQAVNPLRGGIRWKLDEFEPKEYDIINKLKVGEISDPYESQDNQGRAVFKVIWLKNRTNPHVGNLKEDYNLFKDKALYIKENEKVNEWVTDKIKSTYIRISENYLKCSFKVQGWMKS
jgi:peptidyl-prolyl cis-trans isomerase SurA